MPDQPVAASGRDEHYMRLALEAARLAGQAGEVPVGAVVVIGDAVVGRGANRTRRDGTVQAHAELIALAEAERNSGDYRLEHAELFATLEPCLMCLGAIAQARVVRLVYGAPEPKFGALASRFQLAGHPALRKLQVTSGVLAEEAAALISGFFAARRNADQGGPGDSAEE